MKKTKSCEYNPFRSGYQYSAFSMANKRLVLNRLPESKILPFLSEHQRQRKKVLKYYLLDALTIK